MPCPDCGRPGQLLHPRGDRGRCMDCHARREREAARRRRAGLPRRRYQRNAGARYTALVEELRAEVSEGLCCYCDGPMAPPRRVHCGEAECERLYNRDVQAVRRAAKRAAGQVCTTCVKPLPAECRWRTCEKCRASQRACRKRKREEKRRREAA